MSTLSEEERLLKEIEQEISDDEENQHVDNPVDDPSNDQPDNGPMIIPKEEEDSPSQSEVPPQQSEVLPQQSEVPPTESEVHPQQSEVPPTESEVHQESADENPEELYEPENHEEEEDIEAAEYFFEEEGEDEIDTNLPPGVYEELVMNRQEKHRQTLIHLIQVYPKESNPNEEEEEEETEEKVINRYFDDIQKRSQDAHQDIFSRSSVLNDNQQILEQLYRQRDERLQNAPPEQLTNKQLEDRIAQMKASLEDVNNEIAELNGVISELSAQYDEYAQKKKAAALSKVVTKGKTKSSSRSQSRSGQAKRTNRK